MATGKGGSSARNAGVKAAFILGMNLAVAGALSGIVAALTGADAFHPGGRSMGLAVLVGWLHVAFGVTAAALRASARFLSDAEEADDLRQEGRALLLGAGALISAGAALILVGLAGPGRPVSAAAGLAAWLLLTILAMILVAVRLRGIDELNRATAREANNLAFKWISLFGGSWAVLAHLDFVAAPSPLAWLTMLGGFSFFAGLVAAGRRGAFDNPASASRSSH